MNLTGIVKKAEKIDDKNTYRLEIALKGLIDTDKLHQRLKNRLVSVERPFSAIVPSPCDGDLIVLDRLETMAAMKSLVEPVEIPQNEPGETIAVKGDFDLDGYDEVLLSNEFISLNLSPRRGGNIYRISTAKDSVILDKYFSSSIFGTINTGIFLSGSVDFKPEKMKFRLLPIGSKSSEKSGMKTIGVRGKTDTLAVEGRFSIRPDLPVVELAYEFDNSAKKAKKKDISPRLKMVLSPFGERLSGVEIIDSNGDNYRFSFADAVPPWAMEAEHISYAGSIQFDKGGATAFRRAGSDEGIIIGFEAEKVSQLWHNSTMAFPNMLLIAKKLTLRKNTKSNWNLDIVPCDKLVSGGGTIIGYTMGKDKAVVTVAGSIPETIVADGTAVELKPYKTNIATAMIDTTIKTIMLPEKKLILEVHA